MRGKGFSFPCPCPATSNDEVFQRFLKTAKAKPGKIYNPFPQIAYSVNFNQAYTQPLVNISYLPPTNIDRIQDPIKRVLAGYRLQVTDLHEWVHIEFAADAPAKILARAVSDCAYNNLIALLGGESWNEEVWNVLEYSNNTLSAISEAITLSEELFAIATSVLHPKIWTQNSRFLVNNLRYALLD
jgi:hypothetical protein